MVSTGRSSGTKPAVTFDRVTKRFGDILAVDNISITIHCGCIHGFLGPNGTLAVVLSYIPLFTPFVMMNPHDKTRKNHKK